MDKNFVMIKERSFLRLSAWVLMVPVLMVAISSFTAPVQDDCYLQLKAIYKKVNASQAPPEGKIYHFDYTVHTIVRDSSRGKNTSLRSEIYMSNTQVHLVSKEVEIYQDKKNAFSIFPSRKTIYWSNSQLGYDKANHEKRVTMFQDTLFDMSKLVECRTTEKKGMRRAVLEPNAKAQQLYKLQKIVFDFSLADETISRITLYFTATSKIKVQEIVYNKLTYNYKGKNKLSSPVYSLVFDRSKKLLPGYTGYKVIDSRIKK